MPIDPQDKLGAAKKGWGFVLNARRSKQLPYLTEYLERATLPHLGLLGGVSLGCGATLVGVVGLQFGLQFFMEWYWALAANLVVGGPVATAMAVWLVKVVRRPRTPRDHRMAEVRKAVHAMKNLLPAKNLAKSLGSALSSLLEESARNWNRAMVALNGPFWTGENLPGHWRTVREQAIGAANDAMEDLVLLSVQNLRPVRQSDWQEVVGDVVGGILGVPRQQEVEPLPPMYEEASQIAGKLRTLAAEVGTATQLVIREQPVNDAVPSATSVDRCLTELRSIQQAETELRQNLGSDG